MNQAPLSIETLTPPPEKVRSSTRKVLFWLILAAIAITGARWYYDEVVLPNRPLTWKSYDRDETKAALEDQRKIMVMFESDENSLNIAMRDAVENKRVRRLVRRNQMLTYRVDSETSAADLQQFLNDDADAEPPVLLVLVGKSAPTRHGEENHELGECIESKHAWVGDDVSADDVYDVLFELRFGRKPTRK